MTATFQLSRRVRRRIDADTRYGLTRRMRRVAHRLGLGDLAAVTVRVVDDDEMTRLHESFVGERKSTDVLAWPREEPEDGGLAGDIALCWDAIVRQAAARKVACLDEATQLCVHGLLHLAGHDHRDRVQARDMLRAERRALRTVGIAVIERPYGGR